MTGILQRFSEEVLDIVHDIIPLLGVGDISEQGGFLTSKVNLHGHLLAISKSEIFEEHSMKKKGVLKRRLEKFKTMTHALGKVRSGHKDEATAFEAEAMMKKEGLKKEEMKFEDGEHYPMMHLLLDAEASLLELLVPIISYVRTLMPRFPFSIIQSIPNPTTFYSEGSSLVYHSRAHHNIFEAQVVSINKTITGKVEYSVLTKNGTREYGIGTESILYPKQPLIEFHGGNIKLHGSIEHERMIQSMYGCTVSHLFFLLEYLLRSELDTKMLHSFPDWGGVESVVGDLKYLSEQVIAILVQTLAHHTVKVHYEYDESENLKKKIADLRDICQKISSMGIRFGRGDISSGDPAQRRERRESIDTPHSKNMALVKGKTQQDSRENEDFTEFIVGVIEYLSRIHDAVHEKMNPRPDTGNVGDFDDDPTFNRSRSHSRTMSSGTDENQTPHGYIHSSVFFNKSPSPSPSPSKATAGRLRTPGGSIRNKIEYID